MTAVAALVVANLAGAIIIAAAIVYTAAQARRDSRRNQTVVNITVDTTKDGPE